MGVNAVQKSRLIDLEAALAEVRDTESHGSRSIAVKTEIKIERLPMPDKAS